MTIEHAADKLAPRPDSSAQETDTAMLYAASEGVATNTESR